MSAENLERDETDRYNKSRWNSSTPQQTTIANIQQEVVRIMNGICPDLGNLVMVDTNSKSPWTKWILTLSNSQGGVFNQANEMPLNPSVFEKWIWEIEKSQRGQAKIIVEQKKHTEVTAKKVFDIQHCSHGSLRLTNGFLGPLKQAAVQRELRNATQGGNSAANRDQSLESEENANQPQNNFNLSSTVRELFTTH
jgi:hypothetical protein